MIPSIRKTTFRETGPSQTVFPGDWWRVSDPDHELHDQPWSDGLAAPDHGIVLLVQEVRVIDQEIHTILLHGHPGWKNPDPIKLLAEAFFCAFSPEPQGEELRAREMARLMGRISQIGASMNDIPEDALLLEDAKTKFGEPQQTGNPVAASEAAVPDALLPGGDVLAMQTRLETEIRIVRARQTWIEARQLEMKEGWGLVTAFQKERAAASMASIASRTAQISSALDKVHSMSLWLGEGIEITTLVEGASAPADQPLHLMQRMLHLDEEIYTHAMLATGFTAGDMSDLGVLLATNPELVQRMLPQPNTSSYWPDGQRALKRACYLMASRPKARHQVADFCSAQVAGFYAAVDRTTAL